MPVAVFLVPLTRNNPANIPIISAALGALGGSHPPERCAHVLSGRCAHMSSPTTKMSGIGGCPER
eukprot:5889102-Amphidinium_carterae.2